MTLNEICEFIVDCPHSTAKDEGNGFPLIRTPNIGKGRLILEGVHRVSKEVYDKRNARAIPQDDDLILAREAPAGNVAIIKNGEKVCLGQRTVLIRPNKNKVYPDFLAYYILAPEQQYELLGSANGATVAHVNIPVIKALPVKLPEMERQKKVAGILKTYDDLIENNQKQIKLLEEAAQRLYKEWFVDLRFPGHEDVQSVDGEPEGWRLGVLSEVASLNVTAIDYDYPYSEIEYVDLGSVNKGHILGKKKYLLQDAPGRARRLAKHGDVIWGMVRPNLKAYALVQNESSNTVYSTGFAIITAKSVPFTFMYCATTTEEFVGYLVGCTNGAAYPAVKPSHFQDAKILIPSENVLKAFHQITEPIFCKIGYLDEMNNHLAEARDRILPKLLSGEIEL